jgi:hypothetical protein
MYPEAAASKRFAFGAISVSRRADQTFTHRR